MTPEERAAAVAVAEEYHRTLGSRKLAPGEKVPRSVIIGVPHYRDFQVDRAQIDENARTVPILFAVGSAVVRWWGIEMLDMSPKSVRMDCWMNNPPFLMNHNTNDQRGAITGGSLTGGELRGTAKLSKSAPGQDLFQDIVDGIRTHVSVGYIVHNYREVKPQEMTAEIKDLALREGLPVYLADDWEPIEGSSAWLGADRQTGVLRAEEDARRQAENEAEIQRQVAARLAEQSTHITPKEDKVTPEEIAAMEKAARDAERARLVTIERMASEFQDVEGISELRLKAGTDGVDANEFFVQAMDLKEKNRSEVQAIATQFKDVQGVDELHTRAKSEKWTPSKFREEVQRAVRGEAPRITTADPSAAHRQGHPVITSMRDLVPHWQRRAVAALSAEVADVRGNKTRADVLTREYKRLEQEVTPAMREAELIAVRDMIEKSGLPKLQQYRLMSSLSGAAGGYLNPTPLLAEIFILVEKWGVARRHFRPMPMVSNTLKLDSLVTEAVAYWVAQGGGITAADLVFGQGTLTLYKLAGISSWTSEMDEDAAIALLPIYIDSIARAIFKKEDLAGFIGDGSGTFGGFTGLLNAAGQVYTMEAGKTSFNDATADDWKGLRDKINIDLWDGSMFFLPPGLVSSLEGLKDLQGRYIYREPAGDLPAKLWGFPIADDRGINALTQADAVSLKFAAFGNPRHMLMGMKREIETVVSKEGILDDGAGNVVFNALQADGAIVRTTERVGFGCVLTNGLATIKTAAA